MKLVHGISNLLSICTAADAAGCEYGQLLIRDCLTCAPCSPCSSDAVHISHAIAGEVVVDDSVDICKVDASPHQISGNESPGSTCTPSPSAEGCSGSACKSATTRPLE